MHVSYIYKHIVTAQIILFISLLKQFQHVIAINEKGSSCRAHRIYRYVIHDCVILKIRCLQGLIVSASYILQIEPL